MDGRKISLLIPFWIYCVTFATGLEYIVPSEDSDYWHRIAHAELNRAKFLRPNIGVAKNIIVFIGDGMGVSTVTAARILKGQLNNSPGEEEKLSFESFPHIGLSKTYNVDAQVSDSAGTATAFFCGVKTNAGIIGLGARSRRSNCSSKYGTEVTSILDWSKAAGKSVGIISTARITHATPAALYAHSPERDWESDAKMNGVTGGCEDIAKQLVDNNNDIDVVLGGGRRSFLRKNDTDPELGPSYNLSQYGRVDGRNLIDDWKKHQEIAGKSYLYVSRLSEFRDVDPKQTDRLLGLFEFSHMQFELDRDTTDNGEPSIEEMTEKTIKILKKNKNGFFLMVEAGRIDHGHHQSRAKKALHDTLAMDRAVMKAKAMTSESDTLIIVTADHSHVFTIAGYPKRGNPLFGLVTESGASSYKLAEDGMPYTTLQYSNGPGARFITMSLVRPNLTEINTDDKEFVQQAGIPRDSETHAGEDVPIYASGPMSHLFHGVHEQHYIAHVMAYASCVGDYSATDSCAQSEVNALVSTNSAEAMHFGPFQSLVALSLVSLGSLIEK